MSWPTEGLSTNCELIIIPWDNSVESYVALGANVEHVRPAFCPNCGCGCLIFWGKRKRFAADRDSDFVLFVRRVRCKGCGKTHTILPSFLLKNQAYLAEPILSVLIMRFIEDAGIRSVAKKHGLPRSTPRRWVERFKQSAKHHYRRLLFLKHNLAPDSQPVSPSSYPQALLNLCAQLFGHKVGLKNFSRLISLATCGCLLFDQPSMAP